ncbi:Predicted oxidoreductase [Palleronia marisminoris]|uniref:General stress protein 69 n=1 Tax=Palleronia marisminoris TaxID=315423 RepID=A0A1Y5RLW4_9RHOB|nr:aldo/keto reductase [Palleronia marisminoris]SFG22244.1 Predicted oxidoreductase [Palleronia marisminoris]SLN17687.1 General stress protein 69 [Palleronia marisminoris]
MNNVTSPDGTPPSALSFGAMQFGGTADEDDARGMYLACREYGVNMFDTAHAYTDGRSEEMLGRLIAKERDEVVVATKANVKRGNSAASIRESCEESRKRLGIDTIDLYYLHRFDPETDLEESFETLSTLKNQGWIRAIGVSNFAAWQVMKAQAVAARFDTRIDAIQPMLNLVKRQVEVELLPMAQDQGMAVFPYSPLGGGLLTGKYRAGGEGRLSDSEMYANRYREEWMHNTAADLATLANGMRTSPATLAVAWAMHRPGVTAPIISARNVEQLMPSLDALSLDWDADTEARVGALTRDPAPATDRSEEAS